MIVKNRFTNSIHDAVGNEPVLDQFDVEYNASYYESAVDDFITGSVVTVVDRRPTPSAQQRGKVTSVVLGNRDATYPGYTTAEKNAYPRVSQRLQKLFEKTSNVFRHQRFFDSSERWYDSCLPDLFTALQHDGTKIKTLTTEMKIDIATLFSGGLISSSDFATASTGGDQPLMILKDHAGKDMDAVLSLSPLASFTTSSIGFITFNVPRLNDADDPSINNEWTWSYPYEVKYNPSNRFLSTNDVLNLNIAGARVLPAMSGSLSANLLPQHDNREPYASAPLNLPNLTYHSKDVNFKLPPLLKGIVPVMPGRLPQKVLSMNTAARNGSRTFNPYDSDSYFYPMGEVHDAKMGFSFLKMGDTFIDNLITLGLVRPNSYDFIETSPPPLNPGAKTVPDLGKTLADLYDTVFINGLNGYTTGSANKLDLIKFFFGFGDVNNVCYGKYTLDKTKAVRIFDYSQLKGGDSDADLAFVAPAIPPVNDGNIGEYWIEVEDVNANTDILWYTHQSTAIVDGYHTSYANDIRWLSSSSPSNNQILASTNEDVPGAPSFPATDTYDSKMFLDVYCESPWQYSYVRGISSLYTASYVGSAAFRMHVHGQTDLLTASAGNIHKTYLPYGITATYLPVNLCELTGSYYGTRDLLTGSNQIITIDPKNSTYTSNVYPPGLWRVGFFFHHHGTAGESSPGPNNRAFITNITLDAFPASAFTPDENVRMGGNNYPEFRDVNVDARNCPKDDDYQFYYYLTGSAPVAPAIQWHDTQKMNTERHRQFQASPVGISPIIRGWKHGLVSGFPTNTSAVWRRGRYGQLRDMLEQRQYGKFVYAGPSPVDDIAVSGQTSSASDAQNNLGPSPVNVSFVKRRYTKNDRGVGYVYNEPVSPESTSSQNLSNEVTSSVPYVDGLSRMR